MRAAPSFCAAPTGWRALVEREGTSVEVPIIGWLADADDSDVWVSGVVPHEDGDRGTKLAHTLKGFVRFLAPGEDRWGNLC